ncbi:hypothetical protein D3C72_1731810 [compost metagenome]
MLLSVGVASGARAAVCSSLVSAAEGATVDEESVFSVFVTPALNLGLKPAGLFTAVASVSAIFSCCGSMDGLAGPASATFVTPGLNRGLKPVGLAVSGAVSFDKSVGADVSSAEVAVFLVIPGLKRGLNPAVEFAAAVDGSVLGSSFCSAGSVVGVVALNLGLKPAGFAAVASVAAGAFSTGSVWIGFLITTVSSSARW